MSDGLPGDDTGCTIHKIGDTCPAGCTCNLNRGARDEEAYGRSPGAEAVAALLAELEGKSCADTDRALYGGVTAPPMTGQDRAINAAANGRAMVIIGMLLNAAWLLFRPSAPLAELAWVAGVGGGLTALAAAYFSDVALSWFPSGHPIANRLYPVCVASTVLCWAFWFLGLVSVRLV